MWDKFGEQNSAEDINDLAKKLLEEGKTEEIYELAEENGLDKDMVDIFVSNDIDFICDIESAAVGKMDQELKAYQKQYVANAIEVTDSLKSLMARERVKYTVHKYGVDIDIDVSGNDLAKAIRKKGKSLNDILKKVFTEAGKIHQQGNPASALVVPMVIKEYLKG